MAIKGDDMIAQDIELLKRQNAELMKMVRSIMDAVMPPLPKSSSPGDIALEMARRGDIEGSKAYLRSLTSKRRTA